MKKVTILTLGALARRLSDLKPELEQFAADTQRSPQRVRILRMDPKCRQKENQLLHSIEVHPIHAFEFIVPGRCRPPDPMLDAHSANLDSKQHVLCQHEKRDNDSCFHSLPLLLI